MLFAVNALGLAEQRATRRATLESRVKVAADLARGDAPCIVWCEMNDESAALAKAIDGAVEVTGSDSLDEKIAKLNSFTNGSKRVIVTKPSIAGFGLNWQHCSREIFVGASHSYEQTYQAIRRCWRFGQKSPVDVFIIRAETEQLVVDNYRRKEADAERLGAEMAAQVLDSVRAEVQSASKREWNPHNPSMPMVHPSWLVTATTDNRVAE